MGKPVVAIVGRPNVGKSTLFNYLSGHRISIVEDTPGVTRDRIYAEGNGGAESLPLLILVVLNHSGDFIKQQMIRQAEIAVETSDVIVFMVDMKTGITASDFDVAVMLRKSDKPVVIAVNKVDNVGSFHRRLMSFTTWVWVKFTLSLPFTALV